MPNFHNNSALMTTDDPRQQTVRFRATNADSRFSHSDRIRFAMGDCSLGSILVATSEIGVCAIALGDSPDALARELQERFPHAELIGGDQEFEQWLAVVAGFVDAPAIGLDLPLDMRGSAFQQRVWQALRQIPLGEKVSYTEFARRIGAPRAVQAVAGACGGKAKHEYRSVPLLAAAYELPEIGNLGVGIYGDTDLGWMVRFLRAVGPSMPGFTLFNRESNPPRLTSQNNKTNPRLQSGNTVTARLIPAIMADCCANPPYEG